MPFSFFRPDGPPRGPGSNGSFSSFSFSSYSNNHTYRSSEQRDFARPRPIHRAAPPPQQPSLPETLAPNEPPNRLASTMLLRTGVTPPPMEFLPTPPSSAVRPTPKEHEQLDRTTLDIDSFYTNAEANMPNSVLHDLSPDSLQVLRESHESPRIFRNISPGALTDWESLYPGINEADGARYEYDGFMERMIVKCMAGSVHDSFPIYFIRAITEGLGQTGQQCRRRLQICTSTDFHNFKGKYEDTCSRKSPDAYIRVAGARGFPSVVVEVGWAESMEDLMDDARLWLLGTAGQTKVVIIVKFNEERNSPSGTDSDSDTDTEPDGDESHNRSEEALLLSTVNASTRQSVLAAALLDLHLRGALVKPLLGSFTATFHVFRRTVDNTIYSDFTTTVLPVPEPGDIGQPQTYALTLADLYGDTPVPVGEDPYRKFVIDMEDFRCDIAHQVPEMEEKRSLDRATSIMKKRGVWQVKATFAGAKKAKRKRDEGGDPEAEYKEKRNREEAEGQDA